MVSVVVEDPSSGFDGFAPPGARPGDVGAVVDRLRWLVEAGPSVWSASSATEQFGLYEQIGRLAEVGQIQVLQTVEASGVHREHGHVSAKVMQAHVAKSSGATAAARDKTRRMLNRCDLIAEAFFTGDIGVDQIRILARVFANVRVRREFIDQQAWFITKATTVSFKRFERKIADWVQLTDMDGPEPNDRAHENRDASLVQDHFSQAWHLKATSTSLVGAEDRAVFDAYIEAEFHKDWETAKAVNGNDVALDKLARTDAQRRADAMHQIFCDAAANPNSSARGKIVHNIIWDAATYEEMIRRYAGADPTPLDPDTYRCSTINGDPINPTEAFIDSLTGAIRRVVIDARGVVIDMGDARFLTGLARQAMQMTHDECDWVACHLPISACQADHLVAHTQGGPTNQENTRGFCKHHNRTKERGYQVWRDEITGAIHIITPGGEQIQ